MSFLGDIFEGGKNFLGGIAPMAGRLIGARFGGPLGSALGGGLGDMVGNALGSGGSSQPQQPPQLPTPRGPSMPFNPYAGPSPYVPIAQSPEPFSKFPNSERPYGQYGSSYEPPQQNQFQNFGNNFGNAMQGAFNKYMPPQYQFSTPNSLGNDFGNYIANRIGQSSSPFSGFGRTIGQGASDLYNRFVAPKIPGSYGNVPFNSLGSAMGQRMSNGLESRFNSYANGPRWYDQATPPQQEQGPAYPGDTYQKGVGEYAGYDNPIGAGEGFVRGYSGRFGRPEENPSASGFGTTSTFSNDQAGNDFQARLAQMRQSMNEPRFAAGGHVPRRTLRDMTEMFGILEELPRLEGAYQ